jgi:hypothetical protein
MMKMIRVNFSDDDYVPDKRASPALSTTLLLMSSRTKIELMTALEV